MWAQRGVWEASCRWGKASCHCRCGRRSGGQGRAAAAARRPRLLLAPAEAGGGPGAARQPDLEPQAWGRLHTFPRLASVRVSRFQRRCMRALQTPGCVNAELCQLKMFAQRSCVASVS
jgi:hypothetical protein